MLRAVDSSKSMQGTCLMGADDGETAEEEEEEAEEDDELPLDEVAFIGNACCRQSQISITQGHNSDGAGTTPIPIK